MGFAAGVRAGSDLVEGVWRENRARDVDKRTAERFGWEKVDRSRADTRYEEDLAQRNKIIALADQPEAVPSAVTPAEPVEGGLKVPQVAGPAADAAQGAVGLRLGTPKGIPTQPVGAPQPTVPVSPGNAAGAIAGTATAPTPVEQATPNAARATPEALPTRPAATEAPPARPEVAAPERTLGRERLLNREYAKAARLKGDYATAQKYEEQDRVFATREIDDKVGKMTEKELMDYAKKNINLEGGMPMVVQSKGKGGYSITHYGPDGEAKETLVNQAQFSELVAAHMMTKEGLAAEGFKRAGGVHKDIGDLVGKYNTGQTTMQEKNNQALRYANMDERERQQVAISAGHLKVAQERAAAARDKEAMDRFQTGKYWSDSQGNTYITVPRVGKKGVDIEAFQVGGDGSMKPVEALPKGLLPVGGGAKSGGEGKWEKAPEEGTVERHTGTNERRRYTKGGYIAEDAPMPAERAAVLIKQGVPKADAGRLRWSSDGTMVDIGGEAVPWEQVTGDMIRAENERGVRQREEDARIRAPLTEPPLPWWQQPVPYSGAPKDEYGEAKGNPGIQYSPYYLGNRPIR